jgi:CheY-like chemotaxis protein
MVSDVLLVDTSHRTTVLLIDDDREQRKYWSDALKKAPFHYSVLEAETGEAGLHLYRQQPVDCVVLDLDMPESGFFTLVRLVPDCERPQIPVVIFTQLMQPTLFDLMKRYGAYACLVKQYSSTEDLVNTIQQAMASVKDGQNGRA